MTKQQRIERARAIRALADTVKTATARVDWALRRNLDQAITDAATQHLNALMEESEALQRMVAADPAQRHKMLTQIAHEEQSRRRDGAGVALYLLRPQLAALRKDYDDLIARSRADVSVAFPTSLDGVDANGLIALAHYREVVRARVDAETPTQLLDRYARALDTKTATSMVEAELIEARVTQPGGKLSATTDDLPVVKRLSELVETARDVRVPREVLGDDIEEIVAAGHRSVKRAEIQQVLPIGPVDHPAHGPAVASYEQESDEFKVEQALRKADAA